MKTRKLLFFNLLLIAALILAACGAEEEITEPPQPTEAPAPTQPAPTAAPSIAELPFSDPLTQGGGLDETSGDGIEAAYTPNGYVIELAEAGGYYASLYSVPFPDDLSITVDVGFGGMSPENGLGIVFRAQDSSNFYTFMVDGNGSYGIFVVRDGEFSPLRDWKRAGAMAGDLYLASQLRVDVAGDRFEVYANGSPIDNVTDSTFAGGTVGLIGLAFDSGDSSTFTNLNVVSYEAREVVEAPSFTQPSDDLRLLQLGPLADVVDLKIDIVEGDVSFLLTLQSGSADDTMAMITMTDPEGNVLYNLHNPETGEFTSDVFATYQTSAGGEFVLYYPQVPQYDLMPGTYTLHIETTGSSIPTGTLLIRSGDVEGRQAIDLSIWVISENEMLNSPEGREEVESRMRDAMDRLLGQQDMQVGQITFYDSTDEDKAQWARIAETAHEEICRSLPEEMASARAWPMVLVDELATAPEDGSDPEPYYGVAPLPGSIQLAGSPNGCYIVAWELHADNYDNFGATVVHEGAHFMSIPHTTEQDGMTFDKFSDTPECAVDQFDADASGDVDEFECASADGSNFIFWSSEGPVFVISAEQAWTMRRHPLFYAVSE